MKKSRGRPRLDVKGERYGNLVAVSYEHVNKKAYWKFACDCGRMTVKRLENVRGGNTKTCGMCKYPYPAKKYRGRTVREWAEKLGIPYPTMWYRLSFWGVERATTEKVGGQGKKRDVQKG